jgi:hypothetical protein
MQALSRALRSTIPTLVTVVLNLPVGAAAAPGAGTRSPALTDQAVEEFLTAQFAS